MQLFNYTISFIIVSTIIYLSHSNSTSQHNDNTTLIGQTRKLESAEIYLCTCKSDINMILATPPAKQPTNNTEYFNVTFPNTTITKTTTQNATAQNTTKQNEPKQTIIIPTNAPSHLRAQVFSPSKTPSP